MSMNKDLELELPEVRVTVYGKKITVEREDEAGKKPGERVWYLGEVDGVLVSISRRSGYTRVYLLTGNDGEISGTGSHADTSCAISRAEESLRKLLAPWKKNTQRTIRRVRKSA